jgi:REP element-mobilizing transposase RayT
MPNPPRGEHPGAWFHVYNRGVEKRDIFLSDVDRQHFLMLLAKAAKRYGTEIHAYVLMTNHFHVLFHTPEPALGRTMQLAMSQYAKWFNRRHKRKGALFESKYGSEPIENAAGVLEVSRYIHDNPVKAAMVANAADYAWSSYRAYTDRAPAPPWLHLKVLIAEVGGSGGRYATFVAEPPPANVAPYDPDTPRSSRLTDAFLSFLGSLHSGPDPPAQRAG